MMSLSHSFALFGGGKQVFLFFQLPLGFCTSNEGALEEKPTEQMEIKKIFSLHLQKILELIHNWECPLLGISPSSAVWLPLKLPVQLLLAYLFV